MSQRERIEVRVTAEEKEAWTRAAEESESDQPAGRRLSAWIKRACRWALGEQER